MGFLAPLALTFAALSLPILIFYMLKLRREQIVVSSTFLWQQVLRDRKANAPWQRLRRNLLLLLQLLFLFLLVMALARPYSEISRAQYCEHVRSNLIVLLDASASMQATDVPPSRFEAARAQAKQIVDRLGANDTMTLIAVSDTPHVLASLTNDRSVLRQALDRVQVTNAQADWEAAFVLATFSAQQALRAVTIILSDGGLSFNLPGLPGQVRYVPIGVTAENLAISALAVRTCSPGDGPQGGGGPQAFVRISNTGRQPASALVQIYIDNTFFDARMLSIAPGDESGFSLNDLPLDVHQVEARLEGDALALDNTAWAVRAPGEQATVLLATPGNIFLERAINLMPNLNPITVRVTGTVTGDQDRANAQIMHGRTLSAPATPPALYIFDCVLPTNLPDVGNLFFIAPPTSTDLFQVTGPLTRTGGLRVERNDPLLRYIDAASLMNDLHVARARSVKPPSWAKPLIEAEGGPLLLAGEVNGRRVAILTFDLHHSDLPLQIVFPILIANLINWLAPTGAVDVPDLLRPGMPAKLRPQMGVDEIVVTSPSGQRWSFPTKGSAPVLFAQTDELGVYTIEQKSQNNAGQTAGRTLPAFAVNLFSEAESHIGPQDAIFVGESPVSGQVTSTVGRREWWRWPALAGLIVLLAEWFVYWRGWTMSSLRKVFSCKKSTHPSGADAERA